LTPWDDPARRAQQLELEAARRDFLKPVAHLPTSRQAAWVATLRVQWTPEMHRLDRIRSGPRTCPR